MEPQVPIRVWINAALAILNERPRSQFPLVRQLDELNVAFALANLPIVLREASDDERDLEDAFVDWCEEEEEKEHSVLEDVASFSELVRAAVARPGEDAAWEEFLADHPELNHRARLAYTDDDLVAAVPEVIRQVDEFYERVHHGAPPRWVYGATARAVAEVLTGLPSVGGLTPAELLPSSGDVNVIGRRLAALARDGRLVRTSRDYESSRRYDVGVSADG